MPSVADKVVVGELAPCLRERSLVYQVLSVISVLLLIRPRKWPPVCQIRTKRKALWYFLESVSNNATFSPRAKQHS